MSDSKVRERFEAFCRQQDMNASHAAWLSWQASRAAALEEAAKVAETHYLRECPTLCGQSITAAIRALAGRGA